MKNVEKHNKKEKLMKPSWKQMKIKQKKNDEGEDGEYEKKKERFYIFVLKLIKRKANYVK